MSNAASPSAAPAGRPAAAPSGWNGLMVPVWIAFAVLVFVSPGTLTSIWEWVRGLPLAAEVILWVVCLPWLLGLAVWESSWDDWVRALVVSAVALFFVAAFGRRNAGS